MPHGNFCRGRGGGLSQYNPEVRKINMSMGPVPNLRPLFTVMSMISEVRGLSWGTCQTWGRYHSNTEVRGLPRGTCQTWGRYHSNPEVRGLPRGTYQTWRRYHSNPEVKKFTTGDVPNLGPLSQ